MSLTFPGTASQTQAEAGSADDVVMTPLRTSQAIAALAPTGGGGGGSGRTLMTGNISFYVSSSGNDTTGDGTTGSPWATVAKAYAYDQQNLDHAGKWTTTCYIQGSSITLGDSLSGSLTGTKGAHNFIVRGTSDGPGLTITSATNGISFGVSYGAQVRFLYLTFQPGSAGISVAVDDGVAEFGYVNINTTGAKVMHSVGGRSLIRCVGPVTVVGVGTTGIVFNAEDNGQIYLNAPFSGAGAPTWTGAFVQGDLGGMIDGTGFSWTGGYPTGPRYVACVGGIVFTGGSGGPNFFPGSSAGNPTTGHYV